MFPKINCLLTQNRCQTIGGRMSRDRKKTINIY